MRKRIVAALLTVVFTMATGIMEPAGAGLPCAAAVAQESCCYDWRFGILWM